MFMQWWRKWFGWKSAGSTASNTVVRRILIFTTVMAVSTLVSVTVIGANGNTDTKSVFNGLSDGISIVLICVAAYCSGLLVGFVFGIPRTVSDAATQRRVTSNTNLEQVSDWLTKIIIGVSLVQAMPILERVSQLGRMMASVLGPDHNDFAIVGSSALILFFLLGFLTMYLWSRTEFYGEVFYLERNLDRENQAAEVASIHEAVKGVDFVQRANRIPLREANLSAMLPRSVARGSNVNDPWKDVFGRSTRANGREVIASINRATERVGRVELVVKAIDGEKPLEGEVWFFLHDTFDEPVVKRSADSGIASISFTAWRAFTIGIMADEGETMLELNLANQPGAPGLWASEE